MIFFETSPSFPTRCLMNELVRGLRSLTLTFGAAQMLCQWWNKLKSFNITRCRMEGRRRAGRRRTFFVQTLTETSTDEWTLDIAESDVPPDLSTSEMTELVARFDRSLRLFDLKSSDLDILSERPQSGDKPKKPGVSGHEVGGKKGVARHRCGQH
ncbi:hypothetical protein RSAG8_04789, partial [Rhizoctonia solani AG-8 WAC10335]